LGFSKVPVFFVSLCTLNAKLTLVWDEAQIWCLSETRGRAVQTDKLGCVRRA